VPERYPGRVGLQQRILPAYRAPFFDLLAESSEGGLSIFAGEASPAEGVHSAQSLQVALHKQANNRHFMTPGDRFYFCWQSGLMEWLTEWDPNVLILEANPRYLSTPKAVRWMQARRKPVVGWGLGAPRSRGLLEGIRRGRQTRFLSQFDALITYSAQGAEEFRLLGIPGDRVFVAPNAVSPQPIAQPRRPPPDHKIQLTVLFVGRLVERKQVDRLILACHALPDGLKPQLVIVGDGPARQELELIAQKNYPETIFAGAVHGAELGEYYISADLFVLPGTGGLAVQEAMSYGLPVIVGQGDGTQSDLVRPKNGWNATGTSPDELALLIQAALEVPHRLREMGNESFRIVAEEINIEKMVEVFIEVLCEVSEGNP
jgi:glycosyltransferase involved in cell wall biosynthesis